MFRTQSKIATLAIVFGLAALGIWNQPNRQAQAQVKEVVVGITIKCPYENAIESSCWSGAYWSLTQLEGIQSVEQHANGYNCTARVFLKEGSIPVPDPEKWAAQFKEQVDETILFRGVEITAIGTVEGSNQLRLTIPGAPMALELKPFEHKLQWNSKKQTPREPEPSERDAYLQLASQMTISPSASRFEITGPLSKTETGWKLEVREYRVAIALVTSAPRLVETVADSPEEDSSSVESIPQGEKEKIAKVVDLTFQQLRNRYPNQQPVKRGVHAKDHGCVKAEFRVVDGLADEYRIGLFSEPGRRYDAWVRFSNAATLVLPDDTLDESGKRVPGSRGMAIKLLGVSGTPLIPPHGALTQDFLMVNHPVFAFANVEDYEVLSTVLADPANNENPKNFFAIQFAKQGAAAARAKRTLEIVGKIRAADVSSGAFQPQPRSPVDCRYFSGAPFMFGSNAVIKFSATPVDPNLENPTETNDPNYLRKALVQRLQVREGARSVVFQFQVQKRSITDLKVEEDIEDACTEWPEAKYPFVTVATLTIPPQEFDTEERRLACENLFFTPWHGISELRPLGGINRMRKAVYEASSALRHHPKEQAAP